MPAKILLVDDDADEADLFSEALSEIDRSIVCYYAKHGRQACEKLLKKGEQLPDLIFLDINMPVMDGWQCLAVLKENDLLKDIPVIMYSTSGHTRDREQAFMQGAVFFLTKPNDYLGLKDNLAKIVTHLQQNSLENLELP